jgi:hypoxanthine phosphoribosyltransferase
MANMRYVDPDEFLIDTFKLGKKVYKSGFRPKHAISIWRGGTPVGLGVDAFFRSRGVIINHSTIATGSYTGIGEQGEVTVRNLEHLVQVVCPEDGLLIIDDVYESGNTIHRVVELLRQHARANCPQDIRVAAVHHKPGLVKHKDLPIYTIDDVDDDIWIDYPHELADLVRDDDPQDNAIRAKDEEIWNILRSDPPRPSILVPGNREYHYITARDLHLDCIRLGMIVAHDSSWHPDWLLALWPGGVLAGLPIHEVYKYVQKKGGASEPKAPDHISINTSPTRSSFKNAIVGVNYLAERINKDDNVLIIDTTFRAGRLVNDVVMRLKEVLRRNLNTKRIRVASVYYNPEDRSTWTTQPYFTRPHYYLRQVSLEMIYPASVHKLPDPRAMLPKLNPQLADVLFSE